MASNTVSIASVMTCLLVTAASAGPKPKAPAGTVALTTASISGRGPELVAKVKKACKSNTVFADQDGWRVHYALAVPKALPSAEITIKISDISQPREPQPVATLHKVVYSEAEVTRGNFRLTRDEVISPNAKLLVEIESDGELLAKQTFFIQGKVEARPKSIDFSEDEAVADNGEPEVTNRRR